MKETQEPSNQPLDFARVEALFHGALELPAGARAAFVQRAAGDPALAKEVLELLQADRTDQGNLALVDLAELADVDFAGVAAGPLPRPLGPYRLLRVVGQGGMGLVFEAERADGTYEGRVAIKMLRPGPATEGLVRRFLEERRTLARLEHPSIARLIDAGADEHGAPWLALEFVAGERIDRWCDQRQLELDRRLELFEEVLAAVAHAHQQWVVHRDLKPDNILVTEHGRVRLLDFGIAKVLDPEAEGLELTQTGERALTPAYASPEQLAGQSVGPRSDVYSLGLLLFELISGRRPYRGDTSNLLALSRTLENETLDSPARALMRAAPGEPSSVELAARRRLTPRALAQQLKGDLTRISAMALHRDPARRYEDAGSLLADFRRYRAGLPVRASGDGLGYRLSRFVARHRVECALGLSLLLGALIAGVQFVRQSLDSERQLKEIRQLGDAQELLALERGAEELWPAVPKRIPELRAWLERARALLQDRTLHETSLSALTREAGAWLDLRQGRFEDWRGARLKELLLGLDRLTAEDPFGATVDSVEQRLARAESLEQRSLIEPAAAWAQAAERVARDQRFRGFALTPLLGLVPLGRDPDADLEAFGVLDTGVAPERTPDGRFAVGADDGLVLLLIPGGEALIGAQALDPNGERYDGQAELDEAPLNRVQLAPYLLAKYELTQAQWERLAGDNPSDRKDGPTFPVNRVHWLRAKQVLGHFELGLPSEAQWEHAARAGSDTVFFSGDAPAALAGFANLADAYARDNGGSAGWQITAEVSDGHTVHAPVGSFEPNPFGLHDVLGNLWEWVDDLYLSYDLPARAGDGRRLALDPAANPESQGIVARGGSYMNAAPLLRSAERYRTSPTNESRSTGIRAARRLEPYSLSGTW